MYLTTHNEGEVKVVDYTMAHIRCKGVYHILYVLALPCGTTVEQAKYLWDQVLESNDVSILGFFLYGGTL